MDNAFIYIYIIFIKNKKKYMKLGKLAKEN